MNRRTHFLTVLTALFIFPLIFVGAGVTSKDAGMAFPDWPTSDSHLINPPGWLRDNAKLWEHGHRLIGWAVGLAAIASVVSAWGAAGALRTATCVTLAMIVVQGVLGGLRVTEVSRLLAMVHGIWGQLCFCAASATALLAAPSWRFRTPGPRAPGSRLFRRGCVVASAFVFLQLCLGAAYRHLGWREALIGHVLWALVVFVVLSWATMWTLEQYGAIRPFSTLGKWLAGLIAAQMILGGLAFLVKVMGMASPAMLNWAAPTAHVAAGALMFACIVLLTMCAHGLLSRATDDETAGDSRAAVTT